MGSANGDGPAALPEDERQRVMQVLVAEYAVLAGMLAATWSASLVRTSLFLGVLSAVGVALGFASQAGGGMGPTFTVFALVALAPALFLGIATFARTVEVQREAIVYIIGMNRIRFFMTESVPASLPYLVLSTHDDEHGVYRSQGTGIRLRPPRHRLVFALVQTQGIVAVMCSAVAGVIGALAASLMSPVLAWVVGGAAFGATLVAMLASWSRSLAQLRAATRPLNPTPPDGTDMTI